MGEMARTRQSKTPAAEKVRIVLSVLAGEMSAAEAARRHGLSETTVGKWKHAFITAGTKELEDRLGGSPGAQGSPEQRQLRRENQELKLALAEATVQLRIWQHGAEYVDRVPSRTSMP